MYKQNEIWFASEILLTHIRYPILIIGPGCNGKWMKTELYLDDYITDETTRGIPSCPVQKPNVCMITSIISYTDRKKFVISSIKMNHETHLLLVIQCFISTSPVKWLQMTRYSAIPTIRNFSKYIFIQMNNNFLFTGLKEWLWRGRGLSLYEYKTSTSVKIKTNIHSNLK